jgi:hypothetical protein
MPMASASRRTSHLPSAASRASLACVPCRQKHVKCDAKRPVCDRCAAEDKTCHFLNSRRGGLTRSALAERRRHLEDQRRSSPAGEVAQYVPSEFEDGPQQEESSIQPTVDEGYASRSAAASSSTPVDPGSTSIQDLLDQDWIASGDHYIGLYYEHFHHLHPCVLPRKHLDKMLEDPSNHPRLELLLSVIRSVGILCSPFSQRRQEKIANRISAGIDPVQDAFSVQGLLLNSIALYWCGQEDSSREEMDLAIRIALSISMHSSIFAATHSLENPVLEESWRRTWWQLCIVDAYYAAMLHQTSPLMRRLDITTELPCEESEYEAGVCSLPHQTFFRATTTGTDYWVFIENSCPKDDTRLRCSRIHCRARNLFVVCLSCRSVPSYHSCGGEWIRRVAKQLSCAPMRIPCCRNRRLVAAASGVQESCPSERRRR